MAIMTHAKLHFNWLMLTLIFGIWASEPPRAWRTTEKAGPDRVNKAIVQSMFKHVASRNGSLVLILQTYSQIFIVKHID